MSLVEYESRKRGANKVFRDDYGKPWEDYPRPVPLGKGDFVLQDEPSDEAIHNYIQYLDDLSTGKFKRSRSDRYTHYKEEPIVGFRDEPQFEFREFLGGPPPRLPVSKLSRWVENGHHMNISTESDKWGLQYLYSVTPSKNFGGNVSRGRKLVAEQWVDTEDDDKRATIVRGATEAIRNGLYYEE